MLTSGQAYYNDWQNHLYLVAKQASYVRQHVVPTYFLNSVELGWFYPFYAFYGGTLYYLAALAAIALNSAWAAYVGSYVLSVLAAFGGWTWLARQAGLRGWPGYLPGCVFVCGAYYLTDAYGRGAWPEFVGVSTVPVVVAAAWRLLSSRVRNPAAVITLLIATVVLTGSHIITFVFGTLFVACTLGVGLLIQRPCTTGPRGLAWVLGIGALALGLNSWFLVPLLRYKDTVRAMPPGLGYPEFNSNEAIFSLVPTNPLANLTPQLYVQVPVVPLLAATLILLISIPFVRRWKLLAGTGSTIIGFYVVLTLIQNNYEVWGKLPKEAQVVQFTYRLDSYLLACVAGLMLLACRYAIHVREVRHRLGAALLGLVGVATLVQVGFAEHQVWTATTFGPVQTLLADLGHLPPLFYDHNYLNRTWATLEPGRPWIRSFAGENDISPMCASAPPAPGKDCWVRTVPNSFDVSSMEVLIPPHPAGEQIKTNVVPSPLIALDPFEMVGQEGDYAVVSVPTSDRPTPLLVHAVWTRATVIGVTFTAASLLLALGLLGLFAVQRRQRCSQALELPNEPGVGSAKVFSSSLEQRLMRGLR